MTRHDLIVVGEGFAGLACAAEAARLGLTVATFEAEFFGGLVLNVNALHGFDEAQGASGMDHAARLAKANAQAGIKSTNAAVTAVRATGDGFELDTGAGPVAARAVVLATGARLRALGVPGEEDFEGRGVSHCADCDAPMFTDAVVVVAGGNTWALHEALVLARDAAVVHVVHAGDAPDAEPNTLQEARGHDRIRFTANSRIGAIVGDDSGVTAVRLFASDGGESQLECAGVFPFIGLQPNGEIAPAEVARDAEGALRTDAAFQTALPGLWAIGAVRSGFAGWLGDAVAEGRQAAQAVKARLGT